MSDPVLALTEVLSAQADELRALIPLLDEQEAALTRADSAAVADVLLRQDPILRRFHRLEQRREAAATRLAADVGVPTSGVSMSALLARLPRVPAVLTTVRAELRELLHTVDVRNRRNAFLLKRAADFVDGLMRVMLGAAAEPAPAYVRTGQPGRRRGGSSLVDRSA